MKNPDKYRGCLIGGAVGDALGYAVEFSLDWQIFEKYGERGITEYELCDGAALISDDTQMTLFTANGLLAAAADSSEDNCVAFIARCYRDWYKTQAFGSASQPDCAWLNHLPQLNQCRAPGNTCLSALACEKLGSLDCPVNHSKGCGGVMRVAPIGLYFENRPIDVIDRIGAQAAALTHGHDLGYIPAAMLVHIVHLLAHGKAKTVLEAVNGAMNAASCQFAHSAYLPKMKELTKLAIELSALPELDELEAIRQLGAGWVAEETLAIAIYCALKYEHDFEKAMIAAVNHSGDSDSTGAVTGNILGAHLGLKAIPEKFLTHLELRDVILEIADDLYNGPQPHNPLWKAKYIDHTYPNA